MAASVSANSSSQIWQSSASRRAPGRATSHSMKGSLSINLQAGHRNVTILFSTAMKSALNAPMHLRQMPLRNCRQRLFQHIVALSAMRPSPLAVAEADRSLQESALFYRLRGSVQRRLHKPLSPGSFQENVRGAAQGGQSNRGGVESRSAPELVDTQ